MTDAPNRTLQFKTEGAPHYSDQDFHSETPELVTRTWEVSRRDRRHCSFSACTISVCVRVCAHVHVDRHTHACMHGGEPPHPTPPKVDEGRWGMMLRMLEPSDSLSLSPSPFSHSLCHSLSLSFPPSLSSEDHPSPPVPLPPCDCAQLLSLHPFSRSFLLTAPSSHIAPSFSTIFFFYVLVGRFSDPRFFWVRTI